MWRKIISLAIALTAVIVCHADTFPVTSNADNGPGTLREAITRANANGTAVNDLITFNIADITEAGRTINLQSELPALTSNITIDGSTQPGAPLGISSAKVTLYLDHFHALFKYLFIDHAQNVSIFGLCFKYFDHTSAGNYTRFAIWLKGSSNITIGAPGKGNLFSAAGSITNFSADYNGDSVRALTFQSNVCGLTSSNVEVNGLSIYIMRASEITIGGATSAEGNVFSGSSINLFQSANTQSAFFAKVQNNRLGLDWTGSMYFYGTRSIELTGNQNDDMSSTKTFVLDNVIAAGSDRVLLHNCTHRSIIKGNKFNTVDGSVCRGTKRLEIIGCRGVTVGGYTAAEENIFAADVYSQRRGVHFIGNQFGWIYVFNTAPGDPFIKIVTYDNGLITGKANSNAKIQLYTNTCATNNCINRKYLATVYADAAGNWSFPYTTAMPNIVATATDADSSTTAFSEPKVITANRIITDAACGRSNGSVTGITITEGTHFQWVDSYTGQVISTDTNLYNVPAGNYTLIVSNGANGCKWSTSFTVNDVSPPVAVFPGITHASCGQNNGSLTYSTPSSYLSYKWLNANYDSIGSNLSIYNLAPGNYYLKVTVSSDTSCNRTYGPFVVQNLTGPSLNTNNVTIVPASCGNANGSITGITGVNVSGTPFLQWVDSLNRPVGSGYDLLNVLPGKYKLKFKDAGSCDTITTSFYTVTNNGNIVIDTTGKRITASKCIGITGSIQQLYVTGGDSYQWVSVPGNAVVGTAVDVFNLPPGSYQLNVTNSYGCLKSSPVMTVPQAVFIPIGVTGSVVRAPFCGQNNGLTRIMSFNNDSTLYSFRWIDSASGQVIGTGTAIYNLDAGTYQLFATDSNGCEKKIYTSKLGRTPPPVIDYSQAIVKDDQCNAGLGSISGLKITGIYGPTTYTWMDQNNNVVGNAISLQNVRSGTYTLHVNDAGVCSFQSTPFTLNNVNTTIAAPQYDDLMVPKNSSATLTVKNPGPATYKLYADAGGSQTLQQNNTGNFIIPNISSDTAFYVQKITGTCSTAVIRVNISIVDRSYFAIPNAFTPNGDRINESLPVKVVGHIEINYFRIFNRWGQLVFETRKSGDRWDGRLNGVLQSTGVYVWIAEGKDINGNIIRDQGNVVLIR